MAWGKINISGGVRLNYSVVGATSFAGLPATPATNTIGIITTVSAGTPYITNKTLSGLADGDVVIRTGNPAMNRFNALSVGTIEPCPVDAYQQQSGVLVRVPAYIYNGTSWSLIFGKFLSEGVLVSDTFARANGAIGTAEIGGSWTVTSVSIVSQKAKGTEATYTNNAIISVPQTDYGVFADVAWYTGEVVSLFARANSGASLTDFMRLWYDGTALEITRTISSTFTVMGSYAYAWTSGETHRIGIVFSGNAFAAYLDGVLIMTVIDDNATKTLTRAGFATQKTGGVPSTTIDNFLIVG